MGQPSLWQDGPDLDASWKISHLLVVTLIWFGAAQVGVKIVSLALVNAHAVHDHPLMREWFSLVLLVANSAELITRYGAVKVCTWYLIRRYDAVPVNIGLTLHFPTRWIGIAAISGMFLQTFAVLYFNAVRRLLGIPDPVRITGAAPYEVLTVSILIIFLGPIVEEVFFRGFALRVLDRRIGTEHSSFWAILLFLAIHPQTYDSPGFNVPFLASLGILTIYLYRQSGSIVPSVVAHAFTNLAAVFVNARIS